MVMTINERIEELLPQLNPVQRVQLLRIQRQINNIRDDLKRPLSGPQLEHRVDIVVELIGEER